MHRVAKVRPSPLHFCAMTDPMSVVIEWDKAKEIAKRLKEEGKTLVTTNGCFDILHRGHVDYLEKARDQGDFLLVGVNSDESVRKLKGSSRPINAAADRAYVLSALSSVDAVCVFTQDTPEEWLEFIKPDLHVKGGDYLADSLPETAVVRKNGGDVRILKYVDGYSTSETIKKAKL